MDPQAKAPRERPNLADPSTVDTKIFGERHEPARAPGLASTADSEGGSRAESMLGTALAAPPAALDSLTFEERYALLQELARGGMGRVIISSDRKIGREVAIKEMISTGNSRWVARFLRESLMTARLQHPSIIPVYEVGRRASGEPYIVMRRVHGKPLSALTSTKTPLAERLALLPRMLAAIDALAYAHQRNVIHRDLKPDNILVGGFGETVVIDWGLAKDLSSAEESAQEPGDSDESDGSPLVNDGTSAELTKAGSILGTPTYMSLEQARGIPADKRSDVYALGAVLYELLSGEAPYPGGKPRQVLRKVVDGPPPPLDQLVPGLPTDLLSIVNQAMSRDPSARFADAGELAEQLRSFLAGQLVSAHRYSVGELVLRWARKHRVALAVAALALVALGVVGAVSVRRIIAERDRANREAEASKRVADFLGRMFKVSDPSEARGNSVSAREVLDKAARQIDEGLSKEPGVQAQLMHVMGSVYADLGLYPRGESLLRKSLETQKKTLGPSDAATLGTLSDLGSVLYQEGRFIDAEPLMVQAYEQRKAALGADARETLGSMGNLANLYDDTGRFADAEKLMKDAIERRTRVFGADDPDTVIANANLISVLVHEGRVDEAIALCRKAVEGQKRVLGPDHPNTLETTDELTQLLQQQGQFVEAEHLEAANLAAERRVLGPEHPNTLEAMGSLAGIYSDEKRFHEAELLLREAIPLATKVLGADHPDVMVLQGGLADALIGQRQFAEAEVITSATLERRRRVLGPEHPTTLGSMNNLAELYRKEGKLAESQRLYLQVLELRRRLLPPGHRETAATLWGLGIVALEMGDKSKALDYLSEATEHGMEKADLEQALNEPELAQLANEPRFVALTQKAAAAQH